MRLLLVQGDYVAVYEGRRQLAVFAGALQMDLESAEQLRLASIDAIESAPTEEKDRA